MSSLTIFTIQEIPPTKLSLTQPEVVDFSVILTKLIQLFQQGASVLSCTDILLVYAIGIQASDIHCEPYLESARIRLRVDGVLTLLVNCHNHFLSRIIARLKVMANLDSSEYRLPKDGQLLFLHNEVHYTFRLASLPTQHGEKLVLRLLPAIKQLPSIDQLGLTAQQQLTYRLALTQPQGLILVTGPTGSGKSTSLYSGLNTINDGQSNITTVEDPIEIPLTGINQTQINLKTGLNYSIMMRALLRQDPDILMIGEIRDRPTAELALEAALTGHLVLSTLHTKSCYDTLLRLQQMLLPHYLLAASITLIISQRLVRLLCQCCKKLAPPCYLKFANQQYHINHYQAVGCALCHFGYKGRIALYQMLLITPEIRDAILTQSTLEKIKELGLQQNCRPLLLEGLELVKHGKTTLSEITRVIEFDLAI